MNPVQQFLNSINPLNAPQIQMPLQGAKQLVDTTAQTAQQNHWTPGGFANNLANNAGDLVGGFVNMVNPMSPTNPIRQVITNPQQAGPMATGFIKSVGSSLNNTFGQPVNPDTGNLQMPSLSKAEQFAYQRPLDAAANISMVGGLGKKLLGGGGDAAENVAENAGKDTLSPISEMDNLSTAKSAAKQAAEDTANVSDTAANTYLRAFSVRREIGKNIDMQGAAKQMLNDGITGDIPTIQNQVQGILDATEKMKRTALGDTVGPVDLSDAIKRIDNGLGNVPELAGKEGKAAVYKAQLQAYLPKERTIDGGANALEAYDSMKNIRNLGYDLIEQGKDVYGRTINAEKVNVGKTFVDVAKDINDSIDGTLKNQPLIASLRNTEGLQQLSQISPQAAQRASQVSGWRDMQAFQKPYVDMADMAKETQDAAMTPGFKLTGQITDAISKLGGMGVGGSIAGVPGLIGGTMVGQIASPFIQGAIDKLMPTVMTKSASLINNMGDAGLPNLPSMPSLPAMSTAALNSQSKPQAAPQGQQMAPGQTQKTQPVNVSPSFPEVQPDQSGHYQLPMQGTPGNTYMTEQQREQQQSGLTPGTPEYERINQKFNQEQSMARAQATPQIQAFMKMAPPIQKQANQMLDQLNNGQFSMGVLNKWDTLTDARKYVDPQYQSFVTALNGMNNGMTSIYEATTGQKPTDDMLISPKDSNQQAAAKLSFITNYFAGVYGRFKDAYAATTSPSGQLSPEGQAVPAAPPPAQGPQDFSGVVGGALPKIQVPSLQGLPAL